MRGSLQLLVSKTGKPRLINWAWFSSFLREMLSIYSKSSALLEEELSLGFMLLLTLRYIIFAVQAAICKRNAFGNVRIHKILGREIEASGSAILIKNYAE